MKELEGVAGETNDPHTHEPSSNALVFVIMITIDSPRLHEIDSSLLEFPFTAVRPRPAKC